MQKAREKIIDAGQKVTKKDKSKDASPKATKATYKKGRGARRKVKRKGREPVNPSQISFFFAQDDTTSTSRDERAF